MKKEVLEFLAELAVSSLKKGKTTMFGPCDPLLHPEKFAFKNTEMYFIGNFGTNLPKINEISSSKLEEFEKFAYYFAGESYLSPEEIKEMENGAECLKRVTSAIIEYKGGIKKVEEDMRMRINQYKWDKSKWQNFLDDRYGRGVINVMV